MTRREAITLFAAAPLASTIPDIHDPWKAEQKLTRQELKHLVASVDVAYPYGGSAVHELPEHLHRLNRIVIALAEAVL